MGKKLLLWLTPPFGALLIRLIYLTCKKEFHFPKERPDPKAPIIIAFWHGELLMQPFLYQKFRGKHKASVMVSEHSDGELIVRVIRFFGIEAVRGSSRKGGVKALVGALKLLRQGYDVAITPDGPKGPRYSVAPGVLALARKGGAPIYPFSYRSSRQWELGSWDRFIIPKPFSTLHFFVGEPLKNLPSDDNEAKERIKAALMRLNQEMG